MPSARRFNTAPSAQKRTLLLLAIAVVLFFFSLALLPAVELYCRVVHPAIALLILQILVLVLLLRLYMSPVFSRALVIATFVFTILGIAFNAFLLISVRGRC